MFGTAAVRLVIAFLFATPGVLGSERILSTSTPVVKERQPHQNRVEYVATVQDGAGRIFLRTNSYVVLATGLNRWDAAARAWVPADNTIRIVNGYGIAQGGQHRVILAPNTRSAGGLVDLETPQGERIVLKPVGLAVTDTTGRSVFLAEVKASTGVLSEPNVMTYHDAFDLLAGSICIKVGLEGVESDVILSERIDRALLRQLGIDVQTARLEVWHEVLRKPRFKKKIDLIKRPFGKNDEDHTIEFGGMSISPGTAFRTGPRGRLSTVSEVAVAKEFVRIEGTDFLIESVPFLEAEAELEDLPEPLQSAWTGSDRPQVARSANPSQQAKRQRPQSLVATQKNGGAERQLAMHSRARTTAGYVIDYPITLTSQTNFTFRADSTYYVTNRVFLHGTTRLEGGAVIKTVPYSAAVQAAIRVMGDFECATSPYRPAIFTARDDNSVGEILPDSTGVVATNIWYSHFNLLFLGSGTVRVHDIQTRHGHVGLYFGTPGPHYAWNIQAVRCYRAIEAIKATVFVRNALLQQSIYAFNPGLSGASRIHAEHLTIDTATHLFGNGAIGELHLTNSLLSAVGNAAGTNVFRERVETVSSAAFKVAGRGRHYLADASPYRNAGTTAISAETADLLKQTTTFAPTLLSGSITESTTLPAIVERDTDAPDLGFHFYPLDYLASAIPVQAAALKLVGGAHVGVYGSSGFVLSNGGSFISEGTAQHMNALLPYNAVQSDWAAFEGSLEAMIRFATPSNHVNLSFTKVLTLANAPERRLLVGGLTDTFNAPSAFAITHSHLASLTQTFRTGSPQTIRFQNNILENCSFIFEPGQLGRRTGPITLTLQNNLFHGGTLSLIARTGTAPWTVQDNFFNNEALTASGFGANFAPNYNAFRLGLAAFGGPNNQIDILPAFQQGPLGAFYLAGEGSITNLVDAGSRNAGEAQLFHFTTAPAPFSREENSIVDIGFHYAAVDANGAPIDLDTDGDGILDKHEDLNLNGQLDPGETSHVDRDSDFDGDSDPEELAAGTDPTSSRSLQWRSLASWCFDNGTLSGVTGQEPLRATNLAFGQGIETRGVDLSSTNGAVILQYRGLEANGSPNVSLVRGSFRFRLKTFWVSNDPIMGSYRGVGPREWVTLIETTNIAVRIDPDGTNVVVLSRNAQGQTVTNLQGRILQDSESSRADPADPAESFWYDILVTYSPEETKVFWGTPNDALTGSGIQLWNGNSSANQFVSIGSAPDGSGKIKAIIDDVAIYNVPGILQTNPWTFSAVALTNPTGLRLAWNAATNALLDVKRRTLGETNWTCLPAAIGTNLIDHGVVQGERYEYNLNSGFVNPIGVRERFGHTMTASVLGSALESRGKVLLLIDETLQAALQPELNGFITNLVGDGWSVLRTNVPRHIDDYSTTAAFATNWFNITNRIAPAIRSYYTQFSNELKHLLIIGHVTIPYTGTSADDGHQNPFEPLGSHRGAWASDLYYSDVDGVWSDTQTVNDSSFLENRNAPGDGKLDEDYLPSNPAGIAAAEMAVARIDFARLPAFAESETDLLKRYLQKNSRYRHRQLSFDASAIGLDTFGATLQAATVPMQAANETVSKFVPLKPAEHGNFFTSPNSYVLGAQSGPGYVDSMNAGALAQTTANIAAGGVAPACAFYLLRASFFQDWNLQNSFMKAMLTPSNGGLAAGWFLSMGVWRLDPLATGLELGSGWREAVNTRLRPFSNMQSARATQILGDSTLRYPVLPPPFALTGVRSNGMVELTWAPSPEPNCVYNVYRLNNGIDSVPIRLNGTPLSEPNFSEALPGRAARLYMVRALKVTQTGAGSFTNLSQGIFLTR